MPDPISDFLLGTARLHQNHYVVLASQVYVAFLALSFLWIALKRTVGSVVVRLRTWVPPRVAHKPISNAEITITYVHGTWAGMGNWFQGDGALHQKLQKKLAQRVSFDAFIWSGANGVLDRHRAAVALRKHLETLFKDQQRAKHFIVAHSHGGNVVLAALRDGGQRFAGNVDGIACLATPFLVAEGRETLSKVIHVSASFLVSAVAAFTAVASLGRAVTLEALATTWLLAVLLATGALTGSWWLAKSAESGFVPAHGLGADLCKRILVVRAAGDEAGAALGTAYILRWALTVLGKTAAKVVALPLSLVELILQRIAGSKSRRIAIVAYLLLAPALNFYLQVPAERDILKLLSDMFLLGVPGLLLCGVVLLWVAKLLKHSVLIAFEAIIGVIVGTLLLPFGFDVFHCYPFVLVGAEAALPCQDILRGPQVCQLKRENGYLLQHKAYDNRETADLIVEWVGKVAGSPPGSPELIAA